MPDKYEVKHIDDWRTWDDFVRNAVGGTVFSTSSWLRCAQQAMGGEIHIYGCYKNDNLVAGCSALATSRGGFLKATTPALTPYGGFLYARLPAKRKAKLETEQNKAACQLIDRLEEDFNYVQLSHSSTLTDVREFTWRDWDAEIRYTYIIDLSDLEKLWDDFENRTNNVIRKAEKGGFRVRSSDDLDTFVRQYRMIYEKQGIAPYLPEGLVAGFCRAVQESGLSQMYIAEDSEGQAACVVVFVLGFDILYAWVSGADPQFNSSGATALLYWRVFEQMSERYKRFDFMGANIPSIAKFKRGFGGELTPYLVTERYSSKLSEAAFRGGRVAKGAARRLLSAAPRVFGALNRSKDKAGRRTR